MERTTVNVHLSSGEVPEVQLTEYKEAKHKSDFFTVDIIVAGILEFQLFFDTEQQVINFKNKILWELDKTR